MMMGDASAGKCKMMMGDASDEKCKMMMGKDWEGKAMDAGPGHPELQRPSPDQIKIIRSTEGAEADLRAEIDRLQQEVEQLKQDMEALRKP